MPEELVKQLKVGGKMFIPLGDHSLSRGQDVLPCLLRLLIPIFVYGNMYVYIYMNGSEHFVYM
jgi:hypothetical protein